MSDADILASLDFDHPLPACQAAGHDEGTGGCRPEQRASYLIETRRCAGPGMHDLGVWLKGWVCEGYAITLRSAANSTMKCPTCDIRTMIGSTVRVVGPIAFNPKNSLH